MNEPDSQFSRKIMEFRPVLITLAQALISPAHKPELEASDVVQQTLAEAHLNFSLLESFDDGPFFQWLRSSLRHNILDAIKHLRTKKNDASRTIRTSDLEESFFKLERVFTVDESTPSQVLQRNEQVAILLAAIQQLPEKQKSAIILKHLRGHSLSEVATELELSESATAGLLHRGRQTLVRKIEEFDHE